MEELENRIKLLEDKVEKLTDSVSKILSSLNPITHLEAKEVVKDATLQQLLDLLHSDKWPNAIAPELICNTSLDSDKEERAEGVLELIVETSLTDLKFLDYGCGEGWVVNRSLLQKPKLTVGYDVSKHEKWNSWDTSTSAVYSDDWEHVKTLGPFNAILLYDVIDHMVMPQEQVVARLKEIKSILAPDGKIFVRMHPWCSRHSTHLYEKINKAFIHLVFTEEELESIGYHQEKVRKTKMPLFEYSNLFTSAGLKIKNGPHQTKVGVESFFINTAIVAERIKSHYKNSQRQDYRSGRFPTSPLENQFVDYILI